MTTVSEFTLREGEAVSFSLSYSSSLEGGSGEDRHQVGAGGHRGVLARMDLTWDVQGRLYRGGAIFADDVESADV